jgi:hypothetical protein
MVAKNARSEHRSGQPGGKPPVRRWARWVLGVCVVLALAVGAGVYWRLPLAGAVLRAALDRAGIHGAVLTVSALSTSRMRLTGVRLGPELRIGSAEAAVDLWRLPGNPFTQIALDDVRADLTRTDQSLRQMFGNRREGATPATLRTLRARAAGLPAIAIRNLSLRYAPAGLVKTLTGSAEAGREDGGAYAIGFAVRLSGEIAGEPRAVALDGTARIAADAAAVEVRAKTADGAVDGRLTGRAELSPDRAVVGGGVRLDLRDPGALAGLAPVLAPFLEGAGGRVAVTARLTAPVSIGLDMPLGLPGLAAALQRAGPGGVRLVAGIENGSHGAGLQGVHGTITASMGSVAEASDALRMDGELSLRARRLTAAPVTVKEAELNGTFRLTRREDALTLVFPKALRIRAKEISSNDPPIFLSPVAMTLRSGPTHGLRVGLGKADRADLRLKVAVDATRARSAGKQARTFDVAPFTLGLAGTADHRWVMNGHFRVPKLSAAAGNRVGVIEDLEIEVRRSGSGTTGNARGRVSALEGGKPLFHPIPVQSELSQCCDKMTFAGKAILPGSSVATAKGRYDPLAGRGTTSLALPAFRMTPGGGEFRALAPSIWGFDIRSGTVRATADLSWDKKGFDGTAAVGIEDMNLVHGASGTAVQGLSADIRLDRMVPPRTPSGQAVRVKHIAAAVAFDDLSLGFALVDGVAPDVPALHIESFETLFAGGRLSVAPTVMDSAADSSEAAIAVKNVDLAALLAAVGLDGVSGTGRLSGIIPVRWTGQAVSIAGGRLAAAGPGVLRIRSETANKALAQGGKEVALMLSALEDFRYETLTMEIEKETAGEGRIVLRTRGQNPAVRAGQPFVINLNLSGNVDRLAAVAAQAFQLPGALLRTMLPK